MDCTGRLHPKGLPLQDRGIYNGKGFTCRILEKGKEGNCHLGI